jgi:hypothetical protein
MLEEEGLHGVFKRLRRNGHQLIEEEEGLHGVFKRLRRNGHQLIQGTSCVGGGLFICFTCLHVPYSTVTSILLLATPEEAVNQLSTDCHSWEAISWAILCYFLGHTLLKLSH